MIKIEAIIQPAKLDDVKNALIEAGGPKITSTLLINHNSAAAAQSYGEKSTTGFR